mgnify:CR=1 FL=1
MATSEEIDAILADLLDRFQDLDRPSRVLLPGRRLIEAHCPDLDLTLFGELDRGVLTRLDRPHRRPDIRISVDSDDLVRLSRGELSVAQAYFAGRIRIDASVSDLLRLRAVL